MTTHLQLTAKRHMTIIKCDEVITGRIAAMRHTAGIVFTQGQKWAFSPRSGDSLHWFMWNLAEPRDTWVRLVRKISQQSIHGGGKGAHPKSPFLVQSLPMAKPFDGFLRLLRAFISPSTLHQCFTFAAIRFTGYGVISEKPHVGHLPRIFPCTL